MLMGCIVQQETDINVRKGYLVSGRGLRIAGAALCCLMAVSAHAQQGTPATALPDAPLTSVLSGAVTDQNGGLVPDADVTLVIGKPEQKFTATTDSGGRFRFTGLPAGDFKVSVVADGMQAGSRLGTLHLGEQFEMPQIVLRVGIANTDVEVSASRAEIAEAEVKVEEKQRLLGVLPNFYVTYNWHAEPLDGKQKYELAARSIVDWTTFAFTAGLAGVQYQTGSFSGFGYGPSGYGKRYAADFGNVLFGTMLGGAVLPQLFHQDPRYFYKGTGTVRSRVLYALSTAVISRGDNGKWQPAYAGILGNFGAGALSNLYYPSSNRNGAALTIENGSIGIAFDGIGNVIQEFLLKRFTPTAKNSQQQTTN
jgi:hypothetical protein